MHSIRGQTVVDAATFIRLLELERKRTDRSQRPFLLALLELRQGLRDGQQARRHLRKSVIATLHSCVRQTDVIGWYKPNAVMGIIFTELGHEEPPIGKMLDRINAALRAQLTPAQLNAVTLSMHAYPQQDVGWSDTSSHVQLYPDRTRPTLASLVKRLVDVLGSVGLLVLLAPVLVSIGMAIKLTSKGPILFRQRRMSQFGRPFTLLKFRSMYTDADPHVHEQYVQAFILHSKREHRASAALKQEGIYKLSHDPRITPIGRFLRRTSLDELPQLFNVLVGTMSLVGPRPPIPYELQYYEPWQRRRVLDAKPGLTGLWQVQGRSRTTFAEMVRLDLRYIDHWSLWTDLKLLLQTPWAVFTCAGAR